MKLDDPTNLSQRVEVARASLIDAGRPDLASTVVDADRVLDRGMDAVCWTAPRWPDPDDEILMRRAAALASLSTGHDARDAFCEDCIRAMNRPDCERVTRSEFLARRSCGRAS